MGSISLDLVHSSFLIRILPGTLHHYFSTHVLTSSFTHITQRLVTSCFAHISERLITSSFSHISQRLASLFHFSSIKDEENQQHSTLIRSRAHTVFVMEASEIKRHHVWTERDRLVLILLHVRHSWSGRHFNPLTDAIEDLRE